jgi:hypothetical protein
MEYLIRLLLVLPFSLTKYFSILVELKGYFGTNNNQIGRVVIDDVRGSRYDRNEINNQLGTV